MLLVLVRERHRSVLEKGRVNLRHEDISYVLVLEQAEVNPGAQPLIASGFGARSGATLGSWS